MGEEKGGGKPEGSRKEISEEFLQGDGKTGVMMEG
jgi:hypothetical protein